ncbi:MAG: DUF5683 domain-containing protein [Bacteroidota bacterium]|nr:DUF5683 domain-containing protein [Bacteroidota bacterium]
MHKRLLYFTALLFLSFLSGMKLFAQVTKDSLPQKKIDTSITKTNPVTDSSRKNLFAQDTAVKNKYNPRVATLRSLILPGWGQAYNKKYWKIPIIYGALGVTAGVFLYNLKTYKLLRQAVIYRSSGDTNQLPLVDPQFQGLTTESLRIYRNAYRQNIDYSVLVFLVFWGVNIVDATVDAHLKAFDVSPDIGMKIRPGFNYATNSAGLSLVFFVKDKSSKRLLPLP